jgi:hypothetical protein
LQVNPLVSSDSSPVSTSDTFSAASADSLGSGTTNGSASASASFDALGLSLGVFSSVNVTGEDNGTRSLTYQGSAQATNQFLDSVTLLGGLTGTTGFLRATFELGGSFDGTFTGSLGSAAACFQTSGGDSLGGVNMVDVCRVSFAGGLVEFEGGPLPFPDSITVDFQYTFGEPGNFGVMLRAISTVGMSADPGSGSATTDFGSTVRLLSIEILDANKQTISGGTVVSAGGFPYPVTIPTTVTVAASDATAAEAGDPGSVVFTRTGDTTNALAVSYTLGGTAIEGTDYTLTGSSLIPAGASSVTLNVVPILDALLEGSETVTVTVTPDAAYTVGTPDSATVTIADYAGGALKAPSSVAFGRVPVGTAKDKSVTIKNNSRTENLVVRVNAPSPTPSFSLVSGGGTVVIAPRSSQTVTLRFQPTALGAVSGTLLIDSTDPAAPTWSIQLSGTGR